MEGGCVRAGAVPPGSRTPAEEGRGEAVCDEGHDLGAGVREGVDSTDAVFRVCG